jgi:hypothetical protein
MNWEECTQRRIECIPVIRHGCGIMEFLIGHSLLKLYLDYAILIRKYPYIP